MLLVATPSDTSSYPSTYSSLPPCVHSARCTCRRPLPAHPPSVPADPFAPAEPAAPLCPPRPRRPRPHRPCPCRAPVEEPRTEEQIRKDLERLELIKKKR